MLGGVRRLTMSGFMGIKVNFIANLGIPLKKGRRKCLLIGFDKPCVMGHKHLTSELAVGGDSKPMNRLHIDEEIAVMVGCSEHTPLRGQVV